MRGLNNEVLQLQEKIKGLKEKQKSIEPDYEDRIFY
jgi:hypothetical protein